MGAGTAGGPQLFGADFPLRGWMSAARNSIPTSGKNLGLARLKAIADPGLGNDISHRGAVRSQFLAKLAYEYAEILDLLGTLSAPYRRQQGTMRDHFSRMAGQI